ncbi:MAG: hypothetical protein EPO23_07005 [Xanthobacteraceae bacterium]|nr:MAG: hypothetical protein EPO23_07005 [Xanthobacteraceae bacterium]
MQKMAFSVAALIALGAGSALAADMPVKAVAPVVVSPWDIAFGAGITNDYVFRGVTQSNHKPSVNAYFEPRYNINPNLQLYAGLAGSSISFTNRASAEIDGYFGIRPTLGAFALDFGFWYYGYPGGQCIDTVQGGGVLCPLGSAALPNGNVMKADVSFYEVYAKASYTFNDMFTVGGNAYYSPNFLNTGADGTYASVTAKFTGPAMANGIGWYVSGEFGRQWLGTSDAFYGNINFADYNTWNIGAGLTYKVFTLDLRYSGTDLSQANCNAFTSDFQATFNGSFSAINPSGVGSKWCGDAFIAKLSVDSTLAALK